VVDDNSRINLRQKPYQVTNFGEGIEGKNVYKSTKRKLVNTLLIDIDLAEALLQVQEL
jgi:hypothetical protein